MKTDKQTDKPLRVALLCDVPGLWWAANRFSNSRVDYTKLRQLAAQSQCQFDGVGCSTPCRSHRPRLLVHCHAWLADRPGIDKFEMALGHMGYSTSVVPRGNQIDALINQAAQSVDCDVVIIAASSGRYIGLKESLKAGSRLEICAFPVTPCPLDELSNVVDRWHRLGPSVTQSIPA